MLRAYEVMIENGEIKWLKEQPAVKSARAIVTLLEDEADDTQVLPVSDKEPKLEDLGGTEPQAAVIPRRRYDI
ncbi:hypothetical protein [Synechococcus sp. PCC 7336]|uniref:hypothetical protein n=1 Tax=Synechococcus sp. PCC 7336 TaxID=195250 RepID=UPI00034A576D|nr:hypothetical protein [Synechococcus sp. PCC 7336]